MKRVVAIYRRINGQESWTSTGEIRSKKGTQVEPWWPTDILKSQA